MGKDLLALLQNQQNQLGKVLETNKETEHFGLALTRQDAELIVQERKNSLKEQRRIEFGEGIVTKIIYEFCDSDFIEQDSYSDTIIRLQEIFYMYKNEMQDEITDDELIHFMREQFETVCYGDLDYLAETCLDIFAQAVRAGYRGYQETRGYGEFEKFDIVQRWDKELYLETLRELCWR